ncbi:RNA-binding protein Pasilla isoform X3 [Episyrphus balteatus]|uniref:RNA-binding protein Pasilla isoform X3 n=1 Tax=Episyrphus balteatus TaxID=286459 RepID=UPI0024862F3A|nr:RNA-binding protein Pasilla isoform X3 [Episyrphus balteatus]
MYNCHETQTTNNLLLKKQQEQQQKQFHYNNNNIESIATTELHRNLLLSSPPTTPPPPLLLLPLPTQSSFSATTITKELNNILVEDNNDNNDNNLDLNFELINLKNNCNNLYLPSSTLTSLKTSNHYHNKDISTINDDEDIVSQLKYSNNNNHRRNINSDAIATSNIIKQQQLSNSSLSINNNYNNIIINNNNYNNSSSNRSLHSVSCASSSATTITTDTHQKNYQQSFNITTNSTLPNPTTNITNTTTNNNNNNNTAAAAVAVAKFVENFVDNNNVNNCKSFDLNYRNKTNNNNSVTPLINYSYNNCINNYYYNNQPQLLLPQPQPPQIIPPKPLLPQPQSSIVSSSLQNLPSQSSIYNLYGSQINNNSFNFNRHSTTSSSSLSSSPPSSSATSTFATLLATSSPSPNQQKQQTTEEEKHERIQKQQQKDSINIINNNNIYKNDITDTIDNIATIINQPTIKENNFLETNQHFIDQQLLFRDIYKMSEQHSAMQHQMRSSFALGSGVGVVESSVVGGGGGLLLNQNHAMDLYTQQQQHLQQQHHHHHQQQQQFQQHRQSPSSPSSPSSITQQQQLRHSMSSSPSPIPSPTSSSISQQQSQLQQQHQQQQQHHHLNHMHQQHQQQQQHSQQQQQQQQQNSTTMTQSSTSPFKSCWCFGDSTYHMKILVPAVASGAIIGKGGDTIASLQKDSGARVKMSKSHDFYPGTAERVCLITGSVEGIMNVIDFIMDKIREKPDLNTKIVDIDAKQAQERDKQVKILVPNSTAGMIIGKGGAYIKQVKEESGSYVQISQKPKDISLQERCITIIGDKENNKNACKMILSKIVEDPQSGTCLNVSYADVNGPVANFNPTGSPYASNQNAINASTASLNSTLGQAIGGAGTAAGLLVNGTGINLSLNLGAPNPSPNLAVATQLLEHIKNTGQYPGDLKMLYEMYDIYDRCIPEAFKPTAVAMRGSGYSEQATTEVCAALGVLAKYGVLGMGVGVPHTNGAHTGSVGYLGVSALEQSAAAATAAAAGNVFGAVGQVNLEQYTAAAAAAAAAARPTQLEAAAAAAAAQFDPLRHFGSQAAAPISMNNNSFGLAAATGGATAGGQTLGATQMGGLSKSPTPGDLGPKDTKNVEVSENIVGAILGPNGRSLVEIQHVSGANVQISKKGIFAPGTRNRIVTITGQPNAIAKAQFLIEQKINEEESKRARQIPLTTVVN